MKDQLAKEMENGRKQGSLYRCIGVVVIGVSDQVMYSVGFQNSQFYSLQHTSSIPTVMSMTHQRSIGHSRGRSAMMQ